MTNPKITKSSVTISYHADDGYHLEDTYTSIREKPEGALLDAFAELARLLHLFGHGEEAMTRANEAGARVAKFLAAREAPTPLPERS